MYDKARPSFIKKVKKKTCTYSSFMPSCFCTTLRMYNEACSLSLEHRKLCDTTILDVLYIEPLSSPYCGQQCPS